MPEKNLSEQRAGGSPDGEGPAGPEAGSPDQPAAAAEGLEHADLTRQMLEHLPAGAVVVEGERLFLNRAAERITGYRDEELPTLNEWFAALYGERRWEMRELYESQRSSGFNQRATVPLRRKDGEERIIEFAAHRFDETHEVWLMYDVTERVGAEQALRKSEDRLRAVVDTAVEAIITIDRAGIIQSFNPAAERMFGYTADEVIGESVNILMPSPYREEHDQYIQRYLRTGEARIIGIGRELIARRRDGSVFPIELAVGEGDQLQIFTGVIRDISERKAAEERLRQADRLSSIGTLAAGLGHDINNVLLPVRARLDLIEKDALPPRIRKHFEEIRKSAQYLQDLADGLHLLALDPEDREASTESVTLTEWWKQVRTLLSRALPKHVNFEASIPDDLPAIGVPPHRLTQAVLNLLVNSGTAVDEEGRVQLWADVDGDRRLVRLGVTDNGCGMTAEVKSRALEPFFTTKTRGLGTGLGLSLVHAVVQSAGGSVEIDSEPGAGTTITLAFPAEADTSPDVLGADAPRAVVSVEDRRTESLIANLAEMAGFSVETVEPDPPANVDLWVADRSDALRTLRAYNNQDCRVIMVGCRPPEPNQPGLQVIDDPRDFVRLREAIQQVAREVF